MSDKETKWVFYPPPSPPKLRKLGFFYQTSTFDVVPYSLVDNEMIFMQIQYTVQLQTIFTIIN